MTQNQKKTLVVIDNRLYDLTNFSKVHPGGSQIIEEFHETDATDYFYLLHSQKARDMLAKLKSEPIPPQDMIPRSDILNLAFQLEEKGYFKANFLLETIQLLHCVGWMVLAIVLRKMYPFIASICLALGLLMGGWMSHSYDHQRNNILRVFNIYFSTLFLGTSPSWWGTKHARHHLCTNELEGDSDIDLMPVFFLWKPSKEKDSWNRQFQHIYFFAFYSILRIKWQTDSFKHAFSSKNYLESILLTIHWIWVFVVFPWKVWLLGSLVGGTILAWVVTSNHQAETKLEGKTYGNKKSDSKYKIHDLAVHQITTTRNIYCDNWLTNLLCGGLQYQIEHHLFPRMPIYNLPVVRGMIIDYCKTHNLEYLQENCLDIMKRNFDNLKKHAEAKLY